MTSLRYLSLGAALLPLHLASCAEGGSVAPGSGSAASAGAGGLDGGSAGNGGWPPGSGGAGATAESGDGSAGMAGSSGGFSDGGDAPDGSGPSPECTSAAGCTLHSDCCNCLALAPGQPPPACVTTACKQKKCAELGVTLPDCTAGHCSAGLNCDLTQITCKVPEPVCGPGQVPSVKGSCYGPCVPAQQCSHATACSSCPANTVCVANAGPGPAKSLHCVPTPPCSPLNCSCAGALVCVSPLSTCSQNDSFNGPQLTCS